MTPKMAQIATAALSLELDERAELASRLLGSLDDLAPEENQRLWLAEAQRRLSEYDRAEVDAIDCEAALDQIEAELV